jgi:hypothetical protein
VTVLLQTKFSLRTPMPLNRSALRFNRRAPGSGFCNQIRKRADIKRQQKQTVTPGNRIIFPHHQLRQEADEQHRAGAKDMPTHFELNGSSQILDRPPHNAAVAQGAVIQSEMRRVILPLRTAALMRWCPPDISVWLAVVTRQWTGLYSVLPIVRAAIDARKEKRKSILMSFRQVMFFQAQALIGNRIFGIALD